MAKEKKSFEGMKVVTPTFRASYLNVFEPKAFEDGPEKYSVQMIWGKKQDGLVEFKKKVKAVAEKAWGKDEKKWPKNFSWPFRDGDEVDSDMDAAAREVYAGQTYCNADSKQQPGIYDQNKEDIIDKRDFYSGCYARASIFMVPYQDVGGKSGRSGIKLYLQGIQLIKKGESLGRPQSREDFEVVENEDQGTDDSGEDVGF
jgi:hypothetical protein